MLYLEAFLLNFFIQNVYSRCYTDELTLIKRVSIKTVEFFVVLVD